MVQPWKAQGMEEGKEAMVDGSKEALAKEAMAKEALAKEAMVDGIGMEEGQEAMVDGGKKEEGKETEVGRPARHHRPQSSHRHRSQHHYSSRHRPQSFFHHHQHSFWYIPSPPQRVGGRPQWAVPPRFKRSSSPCRRCPSSTRPSANNQIAPIKSMNNVEFAKCGSAMATLVGATLARSGRFAEAAYDRQRTTCASPMTGNL